MHNNKGLLMLYCEQALIIFNNMIQAGQDYIYCDFFVVVLAKLRFIPVVLIYSLIRLIRCVK